MPKHYSIETLYSQSTESLLAMSEEEFYHTVLKNQLDSLLLQPSEKSQKKLLALSQLEKHASTPQ